MVVIVGCVQIISLSLSHGSRHAHQEVSNFLLLSVQVCAAIRTWQTVLTFSLRILKEIDVISKKWSGESL